jgi:hypothetical protein
VGDIMQQWAAADTLIAGIVQRLETPGAISVQSAVVSVHLRSSIRVELRMIHAALKSLHAAGTPLTHDAILEEIRTSEPLGKYGFACLVFETLWQKRPTLDVSDTEFDQAMATLATPDQ